MLSRWTHYCLRESRSGYTGCMIANGRRRKLPYDADAALTHLRTADRKLAGLIEKAGPFTLRLGYAGTPFTSLLESIVYQQLHGKAAATIHQRVRAIYGDADPTPEMLLATPEEQLRAAGLSGNKLAAIRDLAARTLDGTVPTQRAIQRMSDEEIVERLTEVRGIGKWTVEMLLLFRLGRPDVFPATDYGVRKGFALTFLRLRGAVAAEDLPNSEQMLQRARRWMPYRSVATWYLWRACDLARAGQADAGQARQSGGRKRGGRA